MRLSIPEIRERAERSEAAIMEEMYKARAGLKVRPEFETLFNSDPVLAGPELIPAIERRLAEADGEEERCLRYLLEWAADYHMRRATAALDDEHWAWEASSALELDGEKLPLRKMARSVASEGRRALRLEREAARNEMLEELLPMQIDRIIRAREAIGELGYGGFVEARERLCGFSIRALEAEAQQMLASTRDGYFDLFRYHLSRNGGIPVNDARVTDRRWLSRMRWFDDYFDRARVVEQLHVDLRELGLLRDKGPQIERDFESRPLKRAGSFCAPVQIPGRVVICLAPVGGRPDCIAYLAQLGRALHYAYTSPQLPYEYRALGDSSVNEAYGILCYRLALSGVWIRHATGLEGEALDRYCRLARFLNMCRMRRNAAILVYELELLQSAQVSEMDARYVDLLLEATGFRPDPRTFLEHVDPRLSITRTLRGDILSVLLETALRDKYDEDWFRNPQTGEFLLSLFRAGRRDDAVDLALQWSGQRVSAEVLGRDL